MAIDIPNRLIRAHFGCWFAVVSLALLSSTKAGADEMLVSTYALPELSRASPEPSSIGFVVGLGVFASHAHFRPGPVDVSYDRSLAHFNYTLGGGQISALSGGDHATTGAALEFGIAARSWYFLIGLGATGTANVAFAGVSSDGGRSIDPASNVWIGRYAAWLTPGAKVRYGPISFRGDVQLGVESAQLTGEYGKLVAHVAALDGGKGYPVTVTQGSALVAPRAAIDLWVCKHLTLSATASYDLLVGTPNVGGALAWHSDAYDEPARVHRRS
jgi:hypothetical protein